MAEHNKKYKELDLQKMRVEFLGFAFTGVPIDTDHAEYIGDKAGGGAEDNESTTVPKSTPSTTTTSTQPDTPQQSSGTQSKDLNNDLGVDKGEEKLVIRSPDPTILEILVHCAARNTYENLPVKLDTGCDEDWISQKLCDRLKLEAREVLPEEYVMFNGKSFKSSLVTDLCWFAPNGRRSQFTTFRIVENANFDVLLGKQTLLNMKLISVNNNNIGILSKKTDLHIEKNWAQPEDSRTFTAKHIQTKDKPKISTVSSTSSRHGRKWL